MCHTGGASLAKADAHRAVGAGVEAGAGIEARQLREADIHRSGNLAAQGRVPRPTGGDIAQRAIVAGRRMIVIDLRPDLRRIIGRLLGNRLPPRTVLGMEPLAVVERLVELADDGLAVTDQGYFRRLVVTDLLGRDVELGDLFALRLSPRFAA